MIRKLITPSSIEELLSFAKEEMPISFIAGCTDWIIANRKIPANVFVADLSCIEELRGITICGGVMIIGACETMHSVATNEKVQAFAPALSDAASIVGSKQIRNRATIGGNIANASPAADTLPALAALSAVATLRSLSGVREVVIENLVHGVNKSCLMPNELIVNIKIPFCTSQISAFTKVGSRSEVTISRLNLAASAINNNGLATNVRLFAGTLGCGAFSMDEAAMLLENHLITTPAPPFLEALSSAVDRAIPGRYSQLYKRTAIMALGGDLLTMLKKRMEALQDESEIHWS